MINDDFLVGRWINVLKKQEGNRISNQRIHSSMSKKQKIDPDYFLALTLQKKFNEEYKKEKNEKGKIKSGLFEPQPSCSDHDLMSPARKKPMTDRPPFATPNSPLSFNKPTSSKPVSHPHSKPSLPFKPTASSPAKFSSSQSSSLNDSQWEVIDPTPDVHGLFVAFGRRFFQDRLGSVEVKWSKRMTSCAGVCRFKGRRDRFGRGIGEVTISLSEPLLKLRPRSDLVNTLLHEMIHAYLFLFTENPNRADRDDHGQEFQQHMHRINREAGTRITVYHSFHEEVKLYKQHWWQCNGPCKARGPFFGLVKRATNRAPGKYDFWFASHQAECGGEFIKVKEPDNFKARPRKNKENFGGQMGGLGDSGPSASSGRNPGGAGNIRGFGNPHNSSAKRLPAPGQPKIVGFVDLNKSPAGASGQSNRRADAGRPNATVGNPGNKLGNNAGSVGGYTLGKIGGNALGGNRLATPGGSKSGSPKDNDGFYKLGTPLNKNNTSPTNRTFGSPATGSKPNSIISSPSNSSQVPSNPIGSKLLDKLKFDSQGGNSRGGPSSRGGFGGNSRGGMGNSSRGGNRNSSRGGMGNNSRGGNGNSFRGGMGSSSRGGFSGGGGTRMNKGSGTMVLNPTKSATAQPNETAERITKPINKTDENKLNLDRFKPFMGQGQTLGGGTAPDRTKSRLLATSTSDTNAGSSRQSRDRSGNDRNYGSSSRDNSKNDRGSSSNSRDNSGNYRDNNRNIRDNNKESSSNDIGNTRDSKNKKMCLGNRSLYPTEPSTSHSNTQSSRSNSGTTSSPNRSRDHLKWELGDAEMEDDYEYKKTDSSFSRDNDPDRVVNLDDSFEEMEKMMNDTDVDVFDGITDETLNATLGGNESGTSIGGNNNGGRNDSFNGESVDNAEHNDSLDDIFEISSDEDPDDETHCPVCSKPIARARMNQHLENCMELSQVFDNVAIDEDDDDIDEGENGNVFNANDRTTRVNENENDGLLRNDLGIPQGNNDLTITNENEEMFRNDNDSVLDDDLATINAKRFARIAGYQSPGDSDDVTMENINENGDENYDSTKSKANRNVPKNDEVRDNSCDSVRNEDTSGSGDGDGRSGMVKCPICNADVLEARVNDHIDDCLARNVSEEMNGGVD